MTTTTTKTTILLRPLLLIIVCCIAGISTWKQNEPEIEQPEPVKIAIIGGGVGGTGTAYFLKELLEKQNDLKFEITIYEKSYQIGGRLNTVNFDQDQYESGGSIIHERNRYASELIAKFGLKKRVAQSDSRLCIYNGEKFVFCESSWEIITVFKLLRYYGLDLIRLQRHVSKVIDHFERIYERQNEQNAYEQVSELLSAMDSSIYNLTKITYNDLLSNQYKLSKEFIRELAQAVSLVNYGQTVNIPALVGLVSFAGANSDLFSIQGGNKLLPLYLAHYSNARVLLNTQVVSINYLGDHKYRIHSKKLNTNLNEPNLRKDVYDYVIIATPLANENNLIRFNNLTKRNELINDIFEKYHLHRTVATFVKGEVLPKYKDLDILSCDIDREDGGAFFTSLARLHPVNKVARKTSSSSADDGKNEKISTTKNGDDNNKKNDKNVFKVFSNHKLEPHELYSLFEEIQDLQEIHWLAYPEYISVKQPLPPFRIRPGVFYLNAIEWAASAIEMSLIGAKNVALLLCHEMDICPGSRNNPDPNQSGDSGSKLNKIEL